MTFFEISQFAGIALLVVSLLIKPWDVRPMVSAERRKYDAKMRATLFVLVPSVVLITLGIGGRLIMFRGWLFTAGLLSLVVGLFCIYRIYQMLAGKLEGNVVGSSLLAIGGIYGTLFGAIVVGFKLFS